MLKTIATIILLVYIGSPIDFLPDAIPVFGTLDDATAGAIIAKLLTTNQTHKRRIVRHR